MLCRRDWKLTVCRKVGRQFIPAVFILFSTAYWAFGLAQLQA